MLIVAAGLPALPRLQFNFNPLALENQKSPALTSLFRLGKSVPLSTAHVVVPQADADAVAKKLAALPEVARTWTLDSFVPKDQDQKLPIIEAAEKALGPVLRGSPRPAPSDEENVAALKQGAQALQDAAAKRKRRWRRRRTAPGRCARRSSRRPMPRNAPASPTPSCVRCILISPTSPTA